MKKIYYLLIACSFTHFAQAQAVLNWSSPIDVASSNYDNVGPRIALNNNQQAVVLWGQLLPQQNYVAVHNSNEGFSTPILVNGPLTPYVHSVEGATITAKGDNVYVSFGNNETLNDGIYTTRSTDGGLSFDAPISVANLGTMIPSLPTVNVDSYGNPVVCFISTTSAWTQATYQTAISLDGGISYLPNVTANTGIGNGIACECCPATMAISGNNHLLMFRNNDNNIRDIWVTKSVNSGINYTESADIDALDWSISGCPATGPDGIIINDELISVWMSSGGDNGSKVYLSTLTISTMEKGIEIPLHLDETVSATQNYPHIAGQNDTIGIVWQENIVGDISVFFTWSVNGVAELAQNVQALSSSGSNQKYPDIAYGNGVFHIVYENIATNTSIYQTATIADPTLIENIDAPIAITIYPNPVQKNSMVFVNTHNTNRFDATLINASGKTVKNYPQLNGNFIIATQTLQSGLYLLKVTTDKHTKVHKLIVK